MKHARRARIEEEKKGGKGGRCRVSHGFLFITQEEHGWARTCERGGGDGGARSSQGQVPEWEIVRWIRRTVLAALR